jgi:ADP-L-glycero-D-manno-heptose 6-epimerase
MASVPFHGFNQIVEKGELKLFKSHKIGIADGEQKRDFVYIKDILKIIKFLSAFKTPSGIYNCGSGKAETFLDLSKALFAALEKPEKIQWIDTPIEVRASYQYFTQADMTKLRTAGYQEAMTPLKDAVVDYVRELKAGKRLNS